MKALEKSSQNNSSPIKKKQGQPTKYRPEYCQMIQDYMAEGHSLTSFAATIGVHKDSIYEWARVHPAFSVAYKNAKLKCEKWWEEQAKDNIILDKETKFNSAAWIFYMKNRFGWTDRQDINQTTTININIDKPQADQMCQLIEEDAVLLTE